MGNIFNSDFQDFITALNRSEVEYVLVGGYSVILHGYARTTGDLDIWVNKTVENYQKIVHAFKMFGMPVFDMTEENFLNNSNVDVFTFGRPPVSIDLITSIKGLEFEPTYKKALVHKVDELEIRLIHLNDLIQAKKSAGRPRDMNDIEHLNKPEE